MRERAAATLGEADDGDLAGERTGRALRAGDRGGQPLAAPLVGGEDVFAVDQDDVIALARVRARASSSKPQRSPCDSDPRRSGADRQFAVSALRPAS
jgi:hypothetical protein